VFCVQAKLRRIIKELEDKNKGRFMLENLSEGIKIGKLRKGGCS
jgi:hypothetical protein